MKACLETPLSVWLLVTLLQKGVVGWVMMVMMKSEPTFDSLLIR